MEDYHEEYHNKSKNKSNSTIKIIAIVTIVILACGISFFAGTTYQKSKQKGTLQTVTNNGFPDGRGVLVVGEECDKTV